MSFDKMNTEEIIGVILVFLKGAQQKNKKTCHDAQREGERSKDRIKRMRKDYDVIKQKFAQFIETWKTRDTSKLGELVTTDVHAYFSTVGTSEEGEQHTLFGVKAFVKDIPVTDTLKYEVCNFICRVNGDMAHQAAEVACVAENNDGKNFVFVATFANGWVKENGEWLMNEIRLDIKDYESPLRDYFAETWYFENPLAILTATVHLPCIFPDVDTPYFRVPEAEDLLTEEEKVEECFSKFIYGIDWIIFTYNRDTMADNFKNQEKHAFIAETKWARQRFRYWCHPYKITSVKIDGDTAVAEMTSMIEDCKIRSAEFVKNNGNWQILGYTEV